MPQHLSCKGMLSSWTGISRGVPTLEVHSLRLLVVEIVRLDVEVFVVVQQVVDFPELVRVVDADWVNRRATEFYLLITHSWEFSNFWAYFSNCLGMKLLKLFKKNLNRNQKDLK